MTAVSKTTSGHTFCVLQNEHSTNVCCGKASDRGGVEGCSKIEQGSTEAVTMFWAREREVRSIFIVVA